jgi:hypothetical protein
MGVLRGEPDDLSPRLSCITRPMWLLVCNNLEVNNTINFLYKVLFMNWIFKWYFIFLSIIEFMNHSEFMTGIMKLHNIEYTFKSH